MTCSSSFYAFSFSSCFSFNPCFLLHHLTQNLHESLEELILFQLVELKVLGEVRFINSHLLIWIGSHQLPKKSFKVPDANHLDIKIQSFCQCLVRLHFNNTQQRNSSRMSDQFHSRRTQILFQNLKRKTQTMYHHHSLTHYLYHLIHGLLRTSNEPAF